MLETIKSNKVLLFLVFLSFLSLPFLGHMLFMENVPMFDKRIYGFLLSPLMLLGCGTLIFHYGKTNSKFMTLGLLIYPLFLFLMNVYRSHVDYRIETTWDSSQKHFKHVMISKHGIHGVFYNDKKEILFGTPPK